VPDLLQRLHVVAPGAGSVSDDPRIEQAVDRDLGAERYVLLSPVVRVAPQVLDREAESGSPGGENGP
jgi:hypothetical protein